MRVRRRNLVLIARNLTVLGKRTSIRLEPELWDAFDDVCATCGLTRTMFASRVAARRPGGAFTSAVRVAVLAYYRATSKPTRTRPTPAAALEAALDTVGPPPTTSPGRSIRPE